MKSNDIKRISGDEVMAVINPVQYIYSNVASGFNRLHESVFIVNSVMVTGYSRTMVTYPTYSQEGTDMTHLRPTTNNLEQFVNLLSTQANSTAYPQ